MFEAFSPIINSFFFMKLKDLLQKSQKDVQLKKKNTSMSLSVVQKMKTRMIFLFIKLLQKPMKMRSFKEMAMKILLR